MSSVESAVNNKRRLIWTWNVNQNVAWSRTMFDSLIYPSRPLDVCMIYVAFLSRGIWTRIAIEFNGNHHVLCPTKFWNRVLANALEFSWISQKAIVFKSANTQMRYSRDVYPRVDWSDAGFFARKHCQCKFLTLNRFSLPFTNAFSYGRRNLFWRHHTHYCYFTQNPVVFGEVLILKCFYLQTFPTTMRIFPRPLLTLNLYRFGRV